MGLSSNASKEIVSIFIVLCLFGVLLLISRASGDKESRGQVLVAKGSYCHFALCFYTCCI